MYMYPPHIGGYIYISNTHTQVPGVQQRIRSGRAHNAEPAEAAAVMVEYLIL